MKILKNEKIVAYVVKGDTFNSSELRKISIPLNTYMFSGFYEETHDTDIEVKAKNPKMALEAIGYYSDYEREWGDYKELIRAIDNGDALLYQKYVKYFKRDISKYLKGEETK